MSKEAIWLGGVALFSIGLLWAVGRSQSNKSQGEFEQRLKKAEESTEKAEDKAKQAEKRAEAAETLVKQLGEGLKKQEEAFATCRKHLQCVEDEVRRKEERKQREEAEAPKRKAGEQRVFRVAGVDFKMRWIPAGSFEMKNPHKVTITRGFWLMETEVTQGQYEALMMKNPSHFKNCGKNCPAEMVTWHDAAWFAERLNEAEAVFSPCTGKKVSRCFLCEKQSCESIGNKTTDYISCKGWRLPTEAEWEYAARAGTTTPRYGDLNDIAWWGALYVRGNAQVSYAGAYESHDKQWGTHPVGQKQPNAWGLYDMLGNVWEWVYDGYEDTAHQARSQAAVIDPVRAATASNNSIIRGGSWLNGESYIRAASLYKYLASNWDNTLGFRLLRSSH